MIAEIKEIDAAQGEIELVGRIRVQLSWQATDLGDVATLRLVENVSGEIHQFDQTLEQPATSICFNPLEDSVYISVWLKRNTSDQVELCCAYPVDSDTEFRGVVAHWNLCQPEPSPKPLPGQDTVAPTAFNDIYIAEWEALFPFLCLQSLDSLDMHFDAKGYIAIKQPELVSLYQSLIKSSTTLSDLTSIETIVNKFIASEKFIAVFSSLPKPFVFFADIYPWLVEQSLCFDEYTFEVMLEKKLNINPPLSSLFKDHEYDEFYDQLWSSIIALMLTTDRTEAHQCLLIQYLAALRSLFFIERLSELTDLKNNAETTNKSIDESDVNNAEEQCVEEGSTENNSPLEPVVTIESLFAVLKSTVLLPNAVVPDIPLNPPSASASSVTEDGWFSLIGIGEVHTLYQRAEGYLLGDIAEINNVMPRESRQHKKVEHKHWKQNENQVEQQDRDSESARFDQRTNSMGDEIKHVVANDDRKLDASKLTPSYDNLGLVINGSADLKQTKNDNIENHVDQCARDISDQAANRLKQKVMTQRSNNTLTETTFSHQRNIDNSSSDHCIRAVYRWVDQLFCFETRSQGKSLVMEFLIDTPAKAFKDDILNKNQLPIPSVPEDDFFKSVDNYKKITIDNYLHYGVKYNVQQLPSPPEESHCETVDRSNRESQLIDGEVLIPDGYTAPANGTIKILLSDTKKKITGYVGSSDNLDFGGDTAATKDAEPDAAPAPAVYSKTFTITAGSKKIPYGVISHAAQFSLSINIVCLADANAYAVRLAVWQQEIFRQLEEGYAQQRIAFNREYCHRVEEASEGNQGRIERENLKKSAITLVANRLKTDEPAMLRLIEQWFRWDEMAYRFYDFPAGKPPAVNLARGQTTQPETKRLFSSFLNAGSARVLIPIQQQQLTRVLLSLIFDQPWVGIPNNEITTPKVAKILHYLHNSLEPKPLQKQWQRVVPTPHCFLQDEQVLPSFDVRVEGSK